MAEEEERTRLHETHALVDNKSLPSPSPKTQRSAKRSSKFNRILNNLERSILSQFSNQHNVNNNSRTTKPIKSSHSSTSKSHQTSSSANIMTPISIPIAANLQSQTKKRCNNAQQVQKDSHPTTAATASREKITFQVNKMDSQRQQQKPSKSKMILNKYQQQIVSTMCSNQLLVNNKLSIPPPHANDEARNQNHRLLFGGADTSTKNNNQSSHDTDNRPSSSIRSSANKKADDMSNKIHEVTQLRSNSSPASSAVSLPAIPSKPGSQYHNSNKRSIKGLNSNLLDVDDESGFFTYQSQRSLLTKATTNNQELTDGESQNKKSQNNSMILVPTTQVPLGKIDFNMVSPQQQYLYNYQTQPNPHHNQNHHQQLPQQSMNTQQQQLVAGNQVPIISLDSMNHPHISNNNQQLLNHMTNTQHPQGLNQFNNHRQLYASYGAPLTNVTVSSNTLLPYVGAHFDQEQQIYANAPPKPRRYQYYDPNQSMFSPALVATQTQNLPSMSNNATILVKQPYSNQRILTQQHQANHPIYTNASYLQAPRLYQQQMVQGNHQQENNNLQEQHHRQQLQINYPYIQHRHLGIPSTMTKSKSNLDARDLLRFKQSDRQLADSDVNRSNTLRPGNHQQLIYGSRYDGLNSYHNAPLQLSAQQPVGMSNYIQNSNLQRSKSVSHLLADYNNYLTNCNQPHDLINDCRQTSTAPKFISVSSASTNNLNFVGLVPVSGQQVSQVNQFVKVPSQLEISQPSHYNNNNHNDSVLQHNLANNNLGGTKVYSATALRQQRHQQRINFWPGLQASPNNNFNYNSQQQQIRPINPIETNSVLSNTNRKPVRQSPQHNNDNLALESSDGFSSKPSLDDKIRHLLISGDSALIDGSTRADDSVNAGNVTHQPHSSTSNLSSQAARAASIKQQAALPSSSTDQQLPNGNFAYKNSEDAVPNGCENKSSPAQRLQQQQAQPLVNQNKDTNYSVVTSAVPDYLTNRIYINDSIGPPKMGNRQQRQYQVTNHNIKQQLDSPLEQNNNSPRSKNDQISRSSQLIVDLTTPRVLAKTQTTLLATPTNNQNQQSIIQTRDTTSVWPTSINQVGLPVQDSVSISNRGNNLTNEPITPIDSHTTANRSDDVSTFSQSFNSQLSFNQSEADKKLTSNFERTAPYYYSDLKSEEQRQALLSIVQQKSLSPPPKLLSRSTDQSSTRLALKSATLHAGQARVLSENLLAKQQQRQIGLRSKNGQTQVGIGLAGDFSSVCNISKNIDKLFDSPTEVANRDNERMRVQSMLTLNEDCLKNDVSNQDSIQTNSESISSGYYSGDLQKNKNLVTSKSKSLENLSQNDRKATGMDSENSVTIKQKLRVPVYENIRCTDKLLSAINNSTTCLSTANSASRANKHRSTGSETKNHLEDSTDSIFGSESLDDEDFDDGDESDSSLDIIDEIKISSSSSDQLSDISQLIEQLKNNHSKLSEEYRSTLLRISKIINSNNSRTADGSHLRNGKLAKRLQSLKQKSRKCETRSKNQLALIQMMEKVLKQSKLRATNSISTTSSDIDLAADNLVKTNAKGRDLIGSSENDLQKRLVIRPDSVQKVEQNKVVLEQVPPVIKAIVTESKQAVKSDLRDATGVLNCAIEKVSSSNRNQDQQQQKNYDCSPAVDDKKQATTADGSSLSPPGAGHLRNSSIGGGAVSKKISNIEQMKFNETTSRNTNNLNNNKTRLNDDTGSSTDDSSSTFSDENETLGVERSRAKNAPVSSQFIGNKLETNKKGLSALKSFMRDEEDFIEFLSTGGSSHRSQFGASQFSASDFNTSNSESSQSVGCRDSPMSAELFANENSAKMNNTGILKKNRINGCDQNRIKQGDNDGSENNNVKSKDISDSITTTPVITNSNNGNSGKFNNVLGNVIDVDVCSLNNLSRYSPVNNPASC